MAKRTETTKMKTKPIHFWVLVGKGYGVIEVALDNKFVARPQAYFTRQEARDASKYYSGAFQATKVEVK